MRHFWKHAQFGRKWGALVLAILLFSACQENLTEKLQSIGPGQTLESVRALLGAPASIIQAKSNTGLNGSVLVYKTPRGDAQVVLVNDRVYHVYLPGELQSTGAMPAPTPAQTGTGTH